MSDQHATGPIQAAVAPASVLTDQEVHLLTETRTLSWRLEQYEHAYDMAIRNYANQQLFIDFFGVIVAVIFLYFQAIGPPNQTYQTIIANVGTGLSLLVIAAVIWMALAQWKSRIEKMQRLSTRARDLLKRYRKLLVARPIDEAGLNEWWLDFMDYEEVRKGPLAAVSPRFLRKGFQHIARLHTADNVVCGICQKEWTAQSNDKLGHWYWPFSAICSSCGVTK